jgi:riboflavin synthase
VEKGSITLDGISLTLNGVQKAGPSPFNVTVMIVPHTWANTRLPDLREGDGVNVEVDVIAKYVESLWQPSLMPMNS